MNQEAKRFIIEKLNALYAHFEGVKIQYEFNPCLSTHIIEVLPLKTFKDNQDYVLAEMKIEEEFEELFGDNEEILFISEESLNQIEDATFTLGYNTDLFEFIFNLTEEGNTDTIRFNEELTTINSSTQAYALAA